MDMSTASRYRRNDNITDCGILSRSDSRTRARFANQRFNATRLNDGNERQPACGTATRPPFSINCVYFAALALSFAVNAANAQSIESGKCYSRQEIEAALKTDRQIPIIIGNRVTDDKNVNIFTSNDTGSLGYNLEGDKPFGEPSQNVCVRNTYKRIKLNSPDNHSIPDWAQSIRPANGIDVQKAYSNGYRVVMSAESFKRVSETQITVGKTMIIGVNPKDKTSDVWAVSPSNIPDGIFVMRDFRFTQNAVMLLGTEPQSTTNK